MPTSMYKIMKRLEKLKFNLESYRALEVFGSYGLHHTQDIYASVKTVDIWEFEEDCESFLNKFYPGSIVKITDSYKQVQKEKNRYDIVVVDNPTKDVGIHYEHFDFFPSIFNLLNEQAVLILNVVPKVGNASDKRLESRAKFYSTDNPENISIHELKKVYEIKANEAGYQLYDFFKEQRKEWNFLKKKDIVYYFVLILRAK